MTEKEKLQQELQIQQNRVASYASQAIANFMEVTNLATTVLGEILRDPLKSAEEKLETIKYVLNKSFPDTPEGMAKQDFENMVKSFSDMIKDQL